MRRSLVVVLSVALVAAVGGGAMLGSASGDSRARRVVVCPLAHASGARNCCPPPGALCVLRLAIGTAPNPSTAGAPVVISGRSLAGVPVALWQRLPQQRLFRRLLTTSTDSMGQYTMRTQPDTNRQWYVTARGLRSRVVTQRVQALVTLAASSTAVVPDRSVVLIGAVSPTHAGQRVLLEQRSAVGGWRLIARPR